MAKDHEQIVSERIFSDASVVTGFLVKFRDYMTSAKAREVASRAIIVKRAFSGTCLRFDSSEA
jgi:hypothetical protein